MNRVDHSEWKESWKESSPRRMIRRAAHCLLSRAPSATEASSNCGRLRLILRPTKTAGALRPEARPTDRYPGGAGGAAKGKGRSEWRTSTSEEESLIASFSSRNRRRKQ